MSAAAADAPGLVVAFLTELVLLHDLEGFLAREIRAHPIGTPPTALVARVVGERFDPARHPVRTDVKAITLHGLVFDPERGRARVIVDL